MPPSVTVHGASDDLIEVEGAIREEFSAYSDDKHYLAFSDGTVLGIEYTSDGVWEIRREIAGSAEYSHIPNKGSNGRDYSDRAALSGDALTWVVCGRRLARASA